MLHSLKKRLYFVVATYFAFWAKFVLRRWKPRVIIITGSSGKTTLLHLAEAQLGDKAIYSHHANGAIGIPFHILGLPTNVRSKLDWLRQFVQAPVCSFRPAPSAQLYVVEADCDRPREGALVAKLLKPEIVLWVSVYNTHSMNFDRSVRRGIFKTHLDAIAYEFGYFLAEASKLVITNSDQAAEQAQLSRVQPGVEVRKASKQAIADYRLGPSETVYTMHHTTIHVPGLHPRDTGVSLQMMTELLNYLGLPLDPSYSRFKSPPGRSNLLAGKRGVTLIDSTYNTGLGAAEAVLNLLKDYPAKPKWLVVGDILELGSLEQREHEQLAEAIVALKPDRVVLLGTRTKRWTYPIVKLKLADMPVSAYLTAGEVLRDLNQQIAGGEVILFKGAQGLEGVVEQLLAHPTDAEQLVRREAIWVKRRRAWGLPR